MVEIQSWVRNRPNLLVSARFRQLFISAFSQYLIWCCHNISYHFLTVFHLSLSTNLLQLSATILLLISCHRLDTAYSQNSIWFDCLDFFYSVTMLLTVLLFMMQGVSRLDLISILVQEIPFNCDSELPRDARVPVGKRSCSSRALAGGQRRLRSRQGGGSPVWSGRWHAIPWTPRPPGQHIKFQDYVTNSLELQMSRSIERRRKEEAKWRCCEAEFQVRKHPNMLLNAI